jgi:hypothetical protein
VSPVRVDQPDEPDVPPDDHADRRDDQNGGAGGRSARGNGPEAETRSRQECYDDLRRADSLGQSARARQTSAEEQAAWEKWEKDAEDSRGMWTEYQRRWPPEERPQPNRSKDEPGFWYGEGNRKLDVAANARVEAACDQIADRERKVITPAMRAIESQDPDRHLVGLDDCRKGRDRIKEKVCEGINFLKRSPEDAVSLVSDTIRYTFQYRETRYTQGVWADITRLKGQGFQLDILKNSWSGEQYRGINSQWIEPTTGQRFEVQFHTRISFEAKQLTHDAYERLRTKQADKFEELVLEAFQRKVTADVPVPLGADDIPDHPERGVNGR